MAYDSEDFKLEKRYCSETGCNVAFKCFRGGVEMCLESGRCREKKISCVNSTGDSVGIQKDLSEGEASLRT